jgi:hypothetical protein
MKVVAGHQTIIDHHQDIQTLVVIDPIPPLAIVLVQEHQVVVAEVAVHEGVNL